MPTPAPTPLTHDARRARRAAIAQAIAGGATISAVARRFTVSVSSVRAACVEHGVAASSRRPAAGGAIPASLGKLRVKKKTFKILAQLLHTDKSECEIAARYGVSHQRVSEILCAARAAGIRFPGRAERTKRRTTK